MKIREFSREELEQRMGVVDKQINGSLVPKNTDEDVYELTRQELIARWPRRYHTYVQMLRDNKHKQIPSMKRWIHAMNNLFNYISEQKRLYEIGSSELRSHQPHVFEKILDFLEKGYTKGKVKLPTGAGKTVIFSKVIRAMNMKTLIVVPTQPLVAQTIEKLKKHGGIDAGAVYAHAKDVSKDVVVTTYASLAANPTMEDEEGNMVPVINPAAYGMLILDEMHHGKSSKQKKALQNFSRSVTIGFSATPQDDDEYVDIEKMHLTEAAELNAICPAVPVLVRTSFQLPERLQAGEYSEKDLAASLNKEVRNKAAVDVYKKKFSHEAVGRNMKAVAYCIGVDHAIDLADMYNAQGIPAAVVSGRDSKKEKDRKLESFHNGEIAVLCNADLLIEGFDDEDVEVVLNLRPTMSEEIAEQRAGRALRLSEMYPNKVAYIVDFIDGETPLERMPILFTDVIGEPLLGSTKWKNEYTRSNRISVGERNRTKKKSQKIDMSDVEVITDIEELEVIHRHRVEAREKDLPPPGWVTLDWFTSRKLKNRGGPWILDQLFRARYDGEKYKKAKEEGRELRSHEKVSRLDVRWCFNSKTLRYVEYFSPEIQKEMELLFEGVERMEYAPNGWRNTRQIFDLFFYYPRHELKISPPLNTPEINALLEKLSLVHPQYKKDYMSTSNRFIPYYSPELQRKFAEEIKATWALKVLDEEAKERGNS